MANPKRAFERQDDEIDRLRAEVAELRAQHDRMKEANSRLAKANVTLVGEINTLRAALQDGRLMFHAWKAARANMGLPDDHGELNASLAVIDACLAKVRP